MNENLKRLMKQADYPAPEMALRAQKLAELIVRECVDICRYHPSIIVSNNWSGHDVAQDIVQRFEEHFGVER